MISYFTLWCYIRRKDINAKRIFNIYHYQISSKQGRMYRKECQLRYWIDVEIWDEGHGIVALQCHKTSVDVLKGRLGSGRRCKCRTHFSLVTSVRFMSFSLKSLYHWLSRSYSVMCIPDKKLKLMIMKIFYQYFCIFGDSERRIITNISEFGWWWNEITLLNWSIN
jgi:hypothetical protein